VTFNDGGTAIHTAPLSGSGIALCIVTGLTAGSHTITAEYNGDVNFTGSTASLTGGPQVVNQATTTTTLVSSLNPSTYGQTVVFSATVASGGGTPGGLVTFKTAGRPSA